MCVTIGGVYSWSQCPLYAADSYQTLVFTAHFSYTRGLTVPLSRALVSPGWSPIGLIVCCTHSHGVSCSPSPGYDRYYELGVLGFGDCF